VLPCVDVFVADEFFVWGPSFELAMLAFGHPTWGRALRCVGAPNLRMCRDLRLRLVGATNLGEVCIKKSTSKPKIFLIHPPARLLA
jgi:hypothetical protein